MHTNHLINAKLRHALENGEMYPQNTSHSNIPSVNSSEENGKKLPTLQIIMPSEKRGNFFILKIFRLLGVIQEM